jgi:hypothetical protein
MRHYAAALCCALVTTAGAGTFRVPSDEPIAAVRLPETWKVHEHAEFVEAITPEGAFHLLVLPAEGHKVAESVGEAMRYIRRMGTVTVKGDTQKQESGELKGKPFRTFSWDGTDNGEPIRIQCYILSAIEGKPLLVFVWGSLEPGKKYQADVRRVLETVDVP